jgi:starvation-inducible DNA-binding protein
VAGAAPVRKENDMTCGKPLAQVRTRNDLPAAQRERACELLNQRLAECIDLQTQCKQAHWNVKGVNFIALHELFDDINEAVEEYVDLLAERVVQLAGVAEGTLGAVISRTALPAYPPCGSEAAQHLEALATALAKFGSGTRHGIDETTALGDAASADILTEVVRGIDKWLWFVEAHLPERAAPASA